MKIIVTGASGLIGSALVPALVAAGHQVTALVRRATRDQTRPGVTEVEWQPDAGQLDAAQLAGTEAAVHLAGEPIAEGRWTDEKKRRIRASRVESTRLLAETLARLEPRPRALVSASAIGYYGDRGAEVLTEASAPGNDFLAEVCQAWEAAAEPARAAGIRVMHPRIGFVLSGRGGGLPRMLVPFKLGVGGRVASGRQYMSWVALADVVGVVERALTDERLAGPVNTVAPQPLTNAEFTKTLGRVLGRPTIFPIPAFGLRLALGELAEALMLSSARVEPARLRAAGYEFEYPQLEAALRAAVAETD
ncbi:MAG TPA: TIGR01777 family oxidoreductase [Pyrinomonadaceae bacterium]|jgi:hypothetical protein